MWGRGGQPVPLRIVSAALAVLSAARADLRQTSAARRSIVFSIRRARVSGRLASSMYWMCSFLWEGGILSNAALAAGERASAWRRSSATGSAAGFLSVFDVFGAV